MPSSEVNPSVTRLIRAAQDDRVSAVGPLLRVYFDRLVQLARKRLGALPGMAAYDEDVALRSFYSVYQRIRDPTRPLHLTGRDDLWRLLATRTVSRAIDLMRRHRPGEVPSDQDVEQLLSCEPTPEEAAEMADESRHGAARAAARPVSPATGPAARGRPVRIPDGGISGGPGQPA
jgi:ECF sigma factor